MTAPDPKVSVVVTTYNRAPLLQRCLRSILAQACDDFEVIVVDDASTDDTTSIIAQFPDPRLRYHRLDRNCGAPARPRNIGIGLARGWLLFIFDSDDTMLPGCLESFLRAFEGDPRLGLAWSRKNVLDNDGQLVEVEARDRLMTEPPFPLALSYAPGANGLALRREVVETLGGFDEAMPRMDDYEMTLRFLRADRWSHRVLTEITMNVHSDSHDHVSASSRRTLEAREHVLVKHADLFARYPQDYARHLYQLALLRLQVRGDRIGFVKALLASLRLSPRQPRRALTLWRAVVGPKRLRAPRRRSQRRVDLKQGVE